MFSGNCVKCEQHFMGEEKDRGLTEMDDDFDCYSQCRDTSPPGGRNFRDFSSTGRNTPPPEICDETIRREISREMVGLQQNTEVRG